MNDIAGSAAVTLKALDRSRAESHPSLALERMGWITATGCARDP